MNPSLAILVPMLRKPLDQRNHCNLAGRLSLQSVLCRPDRSYAVFVTTARLLHDLDNPSAFWSQWLFNLRIGTLLRRRQIRKPAGLIHTNPLHGIARSGIVLNVDKEGRHNLLWPKIGVVLK